MNASRIASWLRRPVPTEARRLVILWRSLDGDLPIAQWDREQVSEHINAQAIVDTIQDHVEDHGRAATYFLAWMTLEGRTVLIKKITASPASDEDESDDDDLLNGKVRTEEPSPEGIAAQNMRHFEIKFRIANAHFAENARASRETIRDLRAELREVRDENAQLRKERREMFAMLEQRLGLEREEAEQEESRLKLEGYIEKFAPKIMEAVINHQASNGKAAAV
jgi:hypothetical protein